MDTLAQDTIEVAVQWQRPGGCGAELEEPAGEISRLDLQTRGPRSLAIPAFTVTNGTLCEVEVSPPGRTVAFSGPKSPDPSEERGDQEEHQRPFHCFSPLTRLTSFFAYRSRSLRNASLSC